MQNNKIYDSDVKIRKSILAGCKENHKSSTVLNLLRRGNRIYKVMINGRRQYALVNTSMLKEYENTSLPNSHEMREYMARKLKSGNRIAEKYIQKEGSL